MNMNGGRAQPGGAKRSVLSDRYILGEELGRGAYGNVFKGTDLVSSETVAIKQISLAGMSGENLQGVMGEIELLKTLNHPNIVKYIGSFKTRTHLYIILEYMENGALSALIKPNRFGVFPEALAAVYIAQVLRGLHYLHEQGVVHRDIKGANILTTKEGLVKLADFGVAAKLGELEDRRDELQQHVVGTPYWMAPEVIEMTQVTPASDIWSVGCLIIEMLTGSPPYYDLQPMSALFRIVQDDCPPLPDTLSPLLLDFLLRCFQKDPRKRPGAYELLQHEWIHVNRHTLRNSWHHNQGSLPGRQGRPAHDHESVSSVVSRMLALGDEGADAAGTSFGVPHTTGAGLHHTQLSSVPEVPSLPPQTAPGMDAAGRVAAVPTTPLRDGALAVSSPPRMATDTTAAAGVVSPSLASPVAAGPLGAGAVAPTMLTPPPAPHYYPSVPSPEGAWPGTIAGGGQQQQSPQLANGQQHPQQAANGMVLAGPITNLVSMLGGTPQPGGGQLGPWLQDADRMVPAVPGSGRHSGGPLAIQQQQGAAAALLAAGGAASMDGRSTASGVEVSAGSAAGDDLLGPTANSQMLELKRHVRELVRALRPAALSVARAPVPTCSPAAACHALAGLVCSSPDAKQMMMTETGALVLLELLDTDNPKLVEGAMELLLALTAQDDVTLETICLLGVVPAVVKYALPPYPASLRLRTATFLACFFNSPSTLAHFVSCQGLKQLVAMVADLSTAPKQANSASTYSTTLSVGNPSSYQTASTGSQQQQQGSNGTAAESPGLALSQLAISCIFHFLDCYNILPHNYLCRLLAQNGLVPRLYVVLRETITQLNRPPTTSASTGGALKQAPSSTGSTATSNWRASGSAYNTFDARQVKSLQPAWATASLSGRITPNSTAAGIAAGASLTPDSRTVKSGSAATTATPQLPGVGEEAPPLVVPQLTHEELGALQEAAVSLLLLLSNADTLVKGYCCARDVLQQHLDCLSKLQPPSLIRLMRALRWLTCEHAMLPAIKDAGAISVLVPCLSKDRVDVGGLPAAQVQLEALHALYNICKFNKVHLEAAATVGITNHLCRMAHEGITALQQAGVASRGGTPASTTPSHTPRSTQQQGDSTGSTGQQGASSSSPEAELMDPVTRWSRLRGFVVPLMISLVSTSSSTRAKLWAASGPDLFLALLSDQESVSLGVLGALEVWLGEDHARMEPKLTQREPVAQLVALFASIAQSPDKSMLPALLSVLRGLIGRSSKLAVALALGDRPQQQGGIVPSLLAMIDSAAPILRVKILEILRCLYEHYPRPKEFLLLHRIPDVLRRLLETGGRGADAVHQEAQRLLTAFQINVLF